MAKDLQWFKFSPLDWMTGRIRKESAKVQIAFLELMCQYWKNDCKMTKDQAELEIGAMLQPLLKNQLVKVSGDLIKIQFLDEQMVAIDDTSVQRSNAAKSRWTKEHSKTMQVHASALQMHNGAMQNDAEKTREDKTREENTQSVDYFLAEAFNNLYIDQEKMKWGHIDFDFEFETFCSKVRGSPERYKGHDAGGLRLAFQAQLRTAKSKAKPPKKVVNKYEGAEDNKAQWTKEAWEKRYHVQLKIDNDFRKHFGYDELRSGPTMGSNGKS